MDARSLQRSFCSSRVYKPTMSETDRQRDGQRALSRTNDARDASPEIICNRLDAAAKL